MAELKNSLDILKEIGVEEWFMYTEKFQPFFGWFAENITEANIFKESDLRELDNLKDEETLLVDSELKLALEQHESDLAIIRNGKQEIQKLMEDIDMASQIERALDDLASDIQKNNVRIQQNLGALELNAKRLKNEEEKILNECKHRSKELQDLKQENTIKMKDVYRFYSTDHLSPVFIHQMGLNQSYQHCDSFVKHLDLYMDNNFKLEHPSDLEIHDESTHEQAIVDLDKIKIKIYMSSLELSRQQMHLSAQKSLNSAIQSEWKSINMLNLDKETVEMLRKNDDYYKVQTEAALDSLSFLLRQLSSLEVETAAFENTRSKLDRATERLHQMDAIYSVVTGDLMLAELLWLLMQFDIEKLRQRSQWSLLDQYQTDNRAALRRIEIMRQANRTALEPVSELNFSPMYLLANINETGDSNSLALYEKLLQSVRDNLKSLGSKKSERLVVQFFEELQSEEARLRKFLQNGPVTNIVLCDLNAKNALFTIKTSLKQIQYRISEFKSNYLERYTQPMNASRFLQGKHRLWIWFLTEPKTVIKALKSLQQQVKDEAAAPMSRSVKTVSGIKRRE